METKNTKSPAGSTPPTSPIKPSSWERLWQYIEHPLTLTAIGLVLMIVAYFFGLILIIAWLFFVAAIYRTRVFDGLPAKKRILAYPSVALVVAVILYGVHWKVQDIIPIPPPLEPVVHIDPENALLWSTRQGQTVGVFTLNVSNTGPEDVEGLEIKQTYFIAQRLEAISKPSVTRS